jgi:hypothetical protein
MRRTERRGFALFAVIILLAITTAAVAMSLDEAVASIQAGGRVRAAEIIRTGLDDGLSRGMDRLQEIDPAEFTSPPVTWDIFAQAQDPAADDFLTAMQGGPGAIDYPPSATFNSQYGDQFRLRVGARAGQRTRAPEGESATDSYGQIVEILIGLDGNGSQGGANPPSEERVAVGVVLPRQLAHH